MKKIQGKPKNHWWKDNGEIVIDNEFFDTKVSKTLGIKHEENHGFFFYDFFVFIYKKLTKIIKAIRTFTRNAILSDRQN